MKYFSPETDYAALERELTSRGGNSSYDYDEEEDEYSAYEEYAAKYDIPDDEDDPYSEDPYADEYADDEGDDAKA